MDIGNIFLRAFCAASALACLSASPAAAQSRLFSTDASLKIDVDARFSHLVRAASTNTQPYPATLTVIEGAGPAQILPIQLAARGRSRRTGEHCTFPPLSLIFDKPAARKTVFSGNNALKLVTYCRDQDSYEQRIVLEYLAYRLYNIVTPLSFRVRAVEVTYREGANSLRAKRFGFVIEDIDDVAKRNRRKELTVASRQISARQFDARAEARAAVFEFMIGNLDWDFRAGQAGENCCHNSRLIAAVDATPATAAAVTPVPYDFDFSGFVDAPYAVPPPGLPVTRLTERLYRGYCGSISEIPAVFEEYRARRADMMDLIGKYPNLNAPSRAKATRFIESFFAIIDNPARVQSAIVKRCR